MQIQQPASPSAQNSKTELRPEEYNPDMACAKLAAETAARLGTPTIISKNLAVYRSVWKTLNNSEDNPTGYDCSLRVRLYDNLAADSVNIDGRFFERLWAYLMKPKYVISGTPYGENALDVEKPSILSRIAGIFTGKKPESQPAVKNGS